jgi:hypothetical protein
LRVRSFAQPADSGRSRLTRAATTEVGPQLAVQRDRPAPTLVASGPATNLLNGSSLARDFLTVQRLAGNRALVGMLSSAPMVATIQRDVVGDVAKGLDDDQRPSKSSLDAVGLYKKNAKKTSHESWKRVLESVKTQEPYWAEVKDHIMLGDDTTPPKGFHSKHSLGRANCRAVGATNPPAPAAGAPYKQWHRNKSDRGFQNLKISTFFPDSWTEQKIQAAILLQDAGVEHQVESRFALESNDGTTYPSTALANPVKPTA